MAKKDLQKQAKKLGLDFTTKTTVAELEAMIAEAEGTADDDTEAMLANRAERRAADAAEAAEAHKNREANAAEARARVRSAAQQAVDRLEATSE